MPADACALLERYLVLTHALLSLARGETEGEFAPLLSARDEVLEGLKGANKLPEEEANAWWERLQALDEEFQLLIRTQVQDVREVLLTRAQERRGVTGYQTAENHNARPDSIAC